MLLAQKVAVIYGGGGAIGGAIARAFAREGARVYLAGRTADKLARVAAAIRATGGTVESATVDALDQDAVAAFVDGVAEQAGGIDISCNVIGTGDVQRPLLDLAVGEFLQPIENAMRTQFLTTGAAARRMIPRGSGVILDFGGSGPQTIPNMGGFKVSLDAMASLRRQWASELGPHGIRVVTLKTGGVPESLPAGDPMRDTLTEMLTAGTLLKRAASLDDVGNAAAFLASDLARTITATEVNISCGAILD